MLRESLFIIFSFLFFLWSLKKKTRELDVTKIRKSKCSENLKSQTAPSEEILIEMQSTYTISNLHGTGKKTANGTFCIIQKL